MDRDDRTVPARDDWVYVGKDKQSLTSDTDTARYSPDMKDFRPSMQKESDCNCAQMARQRWWL